MNVEAIEAIKHRVSYTQHPSVYTLAEWVEELCDALIAPLKATYTHDAIGKREELIKKLRACDGKASDCCIVVWEVAQYLADVLEGKQQ